MMNYSYKHFEEDTLNLIEDTFNTCTSNKDEIRWLITLLRAFCDIPIKRTDTSTESYNLRLWQYQMHPIVHNYRKKWKCANHGKKVFSW